MGTIVTLCEPMYIGILHYTLGFVNQPCHGSWQLGFNIVFTLGFFTIIWNYKSIVKSQHMWETLSCTTLIYLCLVHIEGNGSQWTRSASLAWCYMHFSIPLIHHSSES